MLVIVPLLFLVRILVVAALQIGGVACFWEARISSRNILPLSHWKLVHRSTRVRSGNEAWGYNNLKQFYTLDFRKAHYKCDGFCIYINSIKIHTFSSGLLCRLLEICHVV